MLSVVLSCLVLLFCISSYFCFYLFLKRREREEKRREEKRREEKRRERREGREKREVMGYKEMEELEAGLETATNMETLIMDSVAFGMQFSDRKKRREQTESALERAFLQLNNEDGSSTTFVPRTTDFKTLVESSCRSLFQSFIVRTLRN